MASQFPDTPWSLIAQAREGHVEKEHAVRQLLEKYWQPVHASLCTLNPGGEYDTEALVYQFFDIVLSHTSLSQLDPQQTRFRDFLKQRLQEFVEQQDPSDISPATERADSLNLAEPLMLPESLGDVATVFDEQWALLVVHRAIENLRTMTSDRPHLFSAFQKVDIDGLDQTDRALAADLGLRPEELDNQLLEARKLFRRFVIADLQAYCISREHTGDELRWLLA